MNPEKYNEVEEILCSYYTIDKKIYKLDRLIESVRKEVPSVAGVNYDGMPGGCDISDSVCQYVLRKERKIENYLKQRNKLMEQQRIISEVLEATEEETKILFEQLYSHRYDTLGRPVKRNTQQMICQKLMISRTKLMSDRKKLVRCFYKVFLMNNKVFRIL